jgi:hypothetical protein
VTLPPATRRSLHASPRTGISADALRDATGADVEPCSSRPPATSVATARYTRPAVNGTHERMTGRDAVGWDVVAVALTTRGHALLALGRWAEAVDVLEAAHALEPTMPEALRNLAVARKSAGDTTGAFAAYRLGAGRSELTEIGVGELQTHPAAGDVVDLSQGSAHRLTLPTADGLDIYEVAAQ